MLSAWGLVAAWVLLDDYLKLAAIATHGLLWWQVLRGVWVMSQDEGSSDWVLVGAVLWWLGLSGFQLLCLLCWLEPHKDASGTPWLQF